MKPGSLATQPVRARKAFVAWGAWCASAFDIKHSRRAGSAVEGHPPMWGGLTGNRTSAPHVHVLPSRSDILSSVGGKLFCRESPPSQCRKARSARESALLLVVGAAHPAPGEPHAGHYRQRLSLGSRRWSAQCSRRRPLHLRNGWPLARVLGKRTGADTGATRGGRVWGRARIATRSERNRS